MKVAFQGVVRIVLSGLLLLGALGSVAVADNPAPSACGRPNC